MTIRNPDGTAPDPEERNFICTAEAARQLITNLANVPEMHDDGSNPFYVFSAEKRHVRVTIFRRSSPSAKSTPLAW